MNVAVIGAGGRLGSHIVETFAALADEVFAVASKPSDRWPTMVRHVPYDSSGEAEQLYRLFGEVEAIVVSAPTANVALQAAALEHGCHVVDVGIQSEVVAGLLALDSRASQAGRSVIAAGGLAPGLTGILGSELLAANPGAAGVDVCLIQSARGTAGLRGTQDMLDLLTQRQSGEIRPMVVSVGAPDAAPGTGPSSGAGSPRPLRHKAVVLPTPESDYLHKAEAIRFYSFFDSASLNGAVRVLRGIRGARPRLYRRLRDVVARKKAAAADSGAEEVVLSGVAVDSRGAPMAWRALRFTSDYGATAAVAAGAARAAVSGHKGAVGPGAGLLGGFFAIEEVLKFESVGTQLIDSTAGGAS